MSYTAATTLNSDSFKSKIRTTEKNSATGNVKDVKTSVTLTQPAHEVPGTSLEGPLKVLTSGNNRGPKQILKN